MINPFYGSMADRWPVYALRIILAAITLLGVGAFFVYSAGGMPSLTGAQWIIAAVVWVLLSWFFGGMSASRAYMALAHTGRGYPLGDRRNARL